MCFYRFRRCPFGTRPRSNLATPWPLILMGFGCFGRWPTTASCNGVSFPSYSFFSSPSIRPPTIPEMCLDVFLQVSKVPFRHPSAVEFGHPLGSFSAGGPRRPLATVSPFQAIASAVVHPYVRPPFRRCAWMCFYGFRRRPFGTRLRSNLATPWALILMGFGCFGRWPRTASCNGVSFPSIASSVVHPYVRPPVRRCAWMCFYGFRRCPFGTRLRSNLATLWALILMGFGCFGRWPTRASCNGVTFPSWLLQPRRCFCCVSLQVSMVRFGHHVWGRPWHAVGSVKALALALLVSLFFSGTVTSLPMWLLDRSSH